MMNVWCDSRYRRWCRSQSMREMLTMLPYFKRYDHLNYARWGPVYLVETHQLPEPVLSEFKRGTFVVKSRCAHKFSQVDPDQTMGWINGTGKKGGGIIGITKTISALCSRTLSFNLKYLIAELTHEMYSIYHCIYIYTTKNN